MNKGYFVHESSCLDDNVLILDGTTVWHFSHLSEGVRVGRNCTIGQNVFVGSKVRIGNNCKIQNNVSVYEGVSLEDDVFCGPSMVFTNVDTPRSAYPRGSSDYLKTLVKRGCTIGANATIVCGVTLGQYSFVGAGAVVTKDVPAYALVYGNPSSIRGWVCECGTKLAIHDNFALCVKCGTRYKRAGPHEIDRVTEPRP